MHQIAFLPDWLSPESIIDSAGPWALLVVCLIVFSETGLLVGFLLPGDTLLVISGLLTHTNDVFGVNIWIVGLLIAVAAFVGGEVGYFIGHKGGPAIFERKESGLFSRKNVERTNAFFERFGALAIILARFVPIVRTFAPFVAGVSQMTFARFQMFNVVGAVAWVVGLVFAGYFFGNLPFIRQYLNLIVLAGIGAAVVPLVLGGLWKLVRGNRRRPSRVER